MRATVPEHVHESDQRSVASGAHPTEALPLERLLPVPSSELLAEALSVEGVELCVRGRAAPLVEHFESFHWATLRPPASIDRPGLPVRIAPARHGPSWPAEMARPPCETGAMDGVSFSNVAPVIEVRDLDRALRRYRKLGFSARAYEGPERYGFVQRDGVELHLSESPAHDRTRHGAELYFYVSDAEALYDAWSASGVRGRFVPPHDTPYGLREFAFVDRDGTAHRVGSPLE